MLAFLGLSLYPLEVAFLTRSFHLIPQVWHIFDSNFDTTLSKKKNQKNSLVFQLFLLN